MYQKNCEEEEAHAEPLAQQTPEQSNDAATRFGLTSYTTAQPPPYQEYFSHSQAAPSASTEFPAGPPASSSLVVSDGHWIEEHPPARAESGRQPPFLSTNCWESYGFVGSLQAGEQLPVRPLTPTTCSSFTEEGEGQRLSTTTTTTLCHSPFSTSYSQSITEDFHPSTSSSSSTALLPPSPYVSLSEQQQRDSLLNREQQQSAWAVHLPMLPAETGPLPPFVLRYVNAYLMYASHLYPLDAACTDTKVLYRVCCTDTAADGAEDVSAAALAVRVCIAIGTMLLKETALMEEQMTLAELTLQALFSEEHREQSLTSYSIALSAHAMAWHAMYYRRDADKYCKFFNISMNICTRIQAFNSDAYVKSLYAFNLAKFRERLSEAERRKLKKQMSMIKESPYHPPPPPSSLRNPLSSPSSPASSVTTSPFSSPLFHPSNFGTTQRTSSPSPTETTEPAHTESSSRSSSPTNRESPPFYFPSPSDVQFASSAPSTTLSSASAGKTHPGYIGEIPYQSLELVNSAFNVFTCVMVGINHCNSTGQGKSLLYKLLTVLHTVEEELRAELSSFRALVRHRFRMDERMHNIRGKPSEKTDVHDREIGYISEGEEDESDEEEEEAEGDEARRSILPLQVQLIIQLHLLALRIECHWTLGRKENAIKWAKDLLLCCLAGEPLLETTMGSLLFVLRTAFRTFLVVKEMNLLQTLLTVTLSLSSSVPAVNAVHQEFTRHVEEATSRARRRKGRKRAHKPGSEEEEGQQQQKRQSDGLEEDAVLRERLQKSRRRSAPDLSAEFLELSASAISYDSRGDSSGPSRTSSLSSDGSAEWGTSFRP